MAMVVSGWSLPFVLEENAMAWSRDTLRAFQMRKPVDERWADLLRKVASGEISKEGAWQTWLEIKEARRLVTKHEEKSNE